VTGNGFPFNLVKRSVAGEPGRAGYEIRIDGVFSAIHIETRPDRPGEAPPALGPSGERPKPEAEPQKPASPASPAPPASPASPGPVRG